MTRCFNDGTQIIDVVKSLRLSLLVENLVVMLKRIEGCHFIHESIAEEQIWDIKRIYSQICSQFLAQPYLTYNLQICLFFSKF